MPRFEHPIEYAFAAEAATSLGLAGKRLAKALDALKDHDSVTTSSATHLARRAELVADASDAFWAYVVQREEFGLLDPEYIREQYKVPDDVWRAMGPKSKA